MELTTVLSAQENVFVLDKSIGYDDYVPLDLSTANNEISAEMVADSAALGNYINDYLKKNNGRAAFGGYKERRRLYRRSSLFSGDEPERDIHIGLDIWAPAGTVVLAALDGVVDSFDYNAGQGNYGPTLVLKHNINAAEFYTLYGHLSVDSIEDVEIGDRFGKGDILGQLGDPSVNGDYPPHLHFQVISNLDGNFGDYPGVCNEADLPYYSVNCPDPNLLLKIKQTTT